MNDVMSDMPNSINSNPNDLNHPHMTRTNQPSPNQDDRGRAAGDFPRLTSHQISGGFMVSEDKSNLKFSQTQKIGAKRWMNKSDLNDVLSPKIIKHTEERLEEISDVENPLREFLENEQENGTGEKDDQFKLKKVQNTNTQTQTLLEFNRTKDPKQKSTDSLMKNRYKRLMREINKDLARETDLLKQARAANQS